MVKVLKNLRVVEMGTFITGPAAAMVLGDLGAEVIKVERPGTGDPFRAFKGGLYSPHFQTYNRNKRSIALDTTDLGDLKTFHELIATADVFIQNFRPGAAEKIGIGEASLRAVNDRLIYCAISGFGNSGPSADRPAYDTVAQAASGFLRLVMPPDNPRVIGPAIADAVTGFFAGHGILAALYEREQTGKGRRLDISMLEAMCYFNLDSFTHYFSAGEVMDPLSRPSVSQSYAFRTSDDNWVAIHMSSPHKFWEGFVNSIGRPDLLEDVRFAERPERIAHQDDLIAIATPIFAEKTRDEWCSILSAAGVPHSAAYNSDEALDDPQAQHLRLKVSVDHSEMGPFTTVRAPFCFDGEVDLDIRPPPTLDEDGDALRAELAAGS